MGIFDELAGKGNKEEEVTQEIPQGEGIPAPVIPGTQGFEDKVGVSEEVKSELIEEDTVVVEEEQPVEEEEEEDTTQEPVVIEEKKDILTGTDEDKDSILLDALTKELYTPNESNTLEIPKEEKSLYNIEVDNSNIVQKVNNYFNENPEVVSFSLEEIGLHNRLVNIKGTKQDFEDFVIIKSELGNIVVHKTREPQSDIRKIFMKEAKDRISKGQRIVINLKETYKFTDEYGIKLERQRFRASFVEIKRFIEDTKMRGIINENGFLIVYE